MARILLADDSPLVRKLVCRALESRGHEIEVAGDGVEAVLMAGRGRFDLVLLDLHMPRMQGYQTARVLKDPDCRFSAPVVILTSSTDPLDHYRVRPVSDHIAIKGDDPSALLDTVDRILESSNGASTLCNPPDTEAGVLERVNELLDRAFIETTVAHEISQIAQEPVSLADATDRVLAVTGDVLAADALLLSTGDIVSTRGGAGGALHQRAEESKLVSSPAPEAETPTSGEPRFEPLRTGGLQGYLGAWGTFGGADLRLLENIATAAAPVLETARLLERLEHEATTDPLTSLPNRRYFTQRLEEELSRAGRTGTRPALLMLDVDHFKKVNDDFGHPAGDRVLQEVADLIRNNLRTEDVAGRLGGEEFALLLSDAGREGAETVARRILEGVPELDLGLGRGVTVSVGIALAGSGEPAEGLIRRTDQALYAAKRGGRNQYRWAGGDGGHSLRSFGE